jgi:diguanylate cyclase
VPPDAAPLVRELVLELTRRRASAPDMPPPLDPESLTTPHGRADALTSLFTWLDGSPLAYGRQVECLMDLLDSMLQVGARLDAKLRRAVLRVRQRIEEDLGFTNIIEEVLHRVGDPPPTAATRPLMTHLEAKKREDRSQTQEFSRQFDAAQEDLALLREQSGVLAAQVKKIREQGLRDGLTGLWNTRAYDDRLEEEVARAQRYGSPLPVALWDLDELKTVNEAYGHLVGDSVLRSVAERVAGLLRRSDVLARYGGEDVAVILPNTGLESALTAAEEIRDTVAGKPVSCGSDPVCVTASVGVASFVAGDSAELLLDRAGQALFRARKAGGNCVQMDSRGASA